jgi:hypothetical protein
MTTATIKRLLSDDYTMPTSRVIRDCGLAPITNARLFDVFPS